jgi:tRNA modification GTPase
MAYRNDLYDTIIAPATAPGIGAIALVRLSGQDAIRLVNEVFQGKNLEEVASHTIHLGLIKDQDQLIDQVLVSVFRAPTSYTKENVVEISSHGSPYIVQKIIQLFLKLGARQATAGEFTKRAFLNGQLDLAQAEAVADLIASDSEIAHKSAMKQMRGGFSNKIKALRERLIKFASLVELELDFGEEDVEFADRDDLKLLIQEIQLSIIKLLKSFELGNVIKDGIPIVIAGKPNAGKSTLLNALLEEEKAIVTDIAGTTRDLIEDEIALEGIKFRFIDTAGLRETNDVVEAIGVEKSRKKMDEAALILYLFDVHEYQTNRDALLQELKHIKSLKTPSLIVANKSDKLQTSDLPELSQFKPIYLAAKTGGNLDELKSKLLELTGSNEIKTADTVVTNARHFGALNQTHEALNKVLNALSNHISGDFLAMDIRQSLHYLSEITGDISTDDLLDSIFRDFCIGK